MSMQTKLRSFVSEAEKSLFPIQHLPYGIFSSTADPTPRVGTAIGPYIVDLMVLEQAGLIHVDSTETYFNQGSLHRFAALNPAIRLKIRQQIQDVLSESNPILQDNASLLSSALIPKQYATMHMPFNIGGFTDFYASLYHVINVGSLFRNKENPLPPNWKHLPMAYNGRASTVFISGTPIYRPRGIIKLPDQERLDFSASQKLDFELEMGIFIATGNLDRRPIPINEARNHIFGLSLLNDWSARDIQTVEYQPLGPFLAKTFATSISPWVVPLEALQDAQVSLGIQDPSPISYLAQERPMTFDIKLQIEIQPQGTTTRTVICKTNLAELYWSMDQMIAHHTVNGCILRPGDLLGTGTISGPERKNWGSLLEMSFNGTQPITLDSGHERRFLEDGDTVIMSGYCDVGDYKIGFGAVEGTIFPPLSG